MIADNRLKGKPLLIARGTWVIITLLILALFVTGSLMEFDTHVTTGTVDFQPYLSRLGLSVTFYAYYRTILNLFEAVAFLAIGIIVFWRKSDDWMVILVSLANIAFGSLFVPTLLQLIKTNPALTLPVGFVRSLGLGLSLIVLYYLFPDGRFSPRWARWAAVAWALLAVIWFISPRFPANLVYMDSWQQNMALSYATFLLAYSTGIAAQLYRYRRVSNLIRRQQTKWVVFGTTTAFLGFILYHIPLVFMPAFGQPGLPRLFHILIGIPIYHLMILMAPLSIAISIARFRLWDVDLVINRSLVSGALSLILGFIYFATVIFTTLVVSKLTGRTHTGFVTAISTLAVASLFNPLRSRLQVIIDKRFYPRKYDAMKTLESFGHVVRDEVDLNMLTAHLVYVLSETMQPAHASIWLHQKELPVETTNPISSYPTSAAKAAEA